MRLQCRPGGFSKIPSRWGYFYADRGLSQTSAQASPATAILPTANPPRSHHKITQLPAEIAEGSIFTAASAYGTAGDVSMIDSLENSVYMYLAFRQACRTTNTMIRLRMHRLIHTCPFGGNLHLAGTCACFDAHAKADFLYGFKIL